VFALPLGTFPVFIAPGQALGLAGELLRWGISIRPRVRSLAGFGRRPPRVVHGRHPKPCTESEVGQPDSITSLAMVSSVGGTANSSSLQTFCSRRDHIGGVTPSRPTRHARPCSVPSACLAANRLRAEALATLPSASMPLR
jgi:hypothetical protein